MGINKQRAAEAALALANKARAKLDLPPMDHLYGGRPGAANACPITNTVIDEDLDLTKYSVMTDVYQIEVYPRDADGTVMWNDAMRFPHEHGSGLFVRWFDKNGYPDLIDNSEDAIKQRT
jgi:hypothetical protein